MFVVLTCSASVVCESAGTSLHQAPPSCRKARDEPPPLFLPTNTHPSLLFELNISRCDSSVQSTCWRFSLLQFLCFFMRR